MPELIPFSGPIKPIAALFEAARERGGRALFVGGCVRDALLGRESKDFDVEIYGLPPAEVEALLRDLKIRFGAAGKSFGVFKLHGVPADVALPRRESKSGRGHRGFSVEGDPSMSVAEAAARRDFTINAIYFDPLSGEVIDPLDGRADLALKVLRHASPAFPEDPLRVLRAMQFAARFRFGVAPETVELCGKIEPEGLSSERIFDEWSKLVTRGEEPSRGLNFLRACGWTRYFPELEALIGVEQDPAWHPEGDVWNHTLAAADVFARERLGDAFEDLVVGFAVLCHDFGKPLCTRRGDDGKIHSYAHDVLGAGPARTFLERLTRERALIDAGIPLVERHMAILDMWRSNAGDAAIRRLANKVGRIDRLVRIDKADRQGRPPVEAGPSPQGEWIIAKAEARMAGFRKDAEGTEPYLRRAQIRYRKLHKGGTAHIGFGIGEIGHNTANQSFQETDCRI